MDGRPIGPWAARAGVLPGLCALMLATGCAPIGEGARSHPLPVTSTQPGFLAPSTLDVLAAAQGPAAGPTAADVAADQALWRREGQTPGSDRWYLAIRHVELRPVFAPQHFDCALGTRLGDADTPAVIELFTRLSRDVEALWQRLRTARPRPIDLGTGRAACVRLPAGDAGHGWSPSGGAALATVWAEAMAEVAPERADALRATGQHMGHSLSICGLAWPQDIAAGERLGHSVWQAVRTDPAYADLIRRASAEIDRAQQDPLENPACAAERRALRDAG